MSPLNHNELTAYSFIMKASCQQSFNVIMFLMTGVLGLHQIDCNNEAAHIQDSISVIAKAFKQLFPELEEEERTFSKPPSSCKTSGVFESGPDLLK